MKKALFCIIFLFYLILSVKSQNQLPRLAVIEFGINLNTQRVISDAITVRNLVESRLVSVGQYQIITRHEIDALLENQRIQASSISSLENIQKLQLLNINYIITGSVDSMGNNYAVTLRVLNVSTGQFTHSVNELMGGSSHELYNGVNLLISSLIARMSPRHERSYQIGDVGPAGGIIFYDKGRFSDGWRYLELSPSDYEFRAEWGAFGHNILGLSNVVGAGRRNTRIIVEYLNQIGETGKAAQIVSELSINGYTDWFLPSEDEIGLLYDRVRRNLHIIPELVNYVVFFDIFYWTSNQNEAYDPQHEVVLFWINDWIRDFGNINARMKKNYRNSVRAIRQF